MLETFGAKLYPRLEGFDKTKSYKNERINVDIQGSERRSQMEST